MMNRHTFDTQNGIALPMALLMSVVLFGIAGAYFTLCMGGFENSTREIGCVQARMAADDGLNLSLAEVKSRIDPDGDGLGNLTTSAPDGRTVSVTVNRLSQTLFELHSVAVLTRARCGADMVVEVYPSEVINLYPNGSLSTRGPVVTTGGVTLDGRDWNLAGTAVVGPGTWGIMTTGSISNTGSSQVGGNGIAPARPPPPGTQLGGYNWSDGINQDGDAATDEEAWDGIDNDGDGFVDEDTNTYPANPDVACHLAPDTLRQTAIWTGTYFTSSSQLQAAIAANGDRMLSGVVIYCDFASWDPADYGSTFNDAPSILVHHNATGTAQMKNIHGKFKGVILMDTLDHLNANVVILGAVMSFAPANATNAIGNGNAYIRYCTSALLNLPLVGELKVRVRSWSRSVAQ